MSKSNVKTTSKKTTKSKVKKTRRFLFLGIGSIIIILVTVFTIGKYWVEIFDKYREKKQLEEELSYLKEKEDEHAEEVLEQCDDVFYENETELNCILEEYAKKIEL